MKNEFLSFTSFFFIFYIISYIVENVNNSHCEFSCRSKLIIFYSFYWRSMNNRNFRVLVPLRFFMIRSHVIVGQDDDGRSSIMDPCTCSRCTKITVNVQFLNPFQATKQQQTMYRRFISSVVEKFHFHFSSFVSWCRRSSSMKKIVYKMYENWSNCQPTIATQNDRGSWRLNTLTFNVIYSF